VSAKQATQNKSLGRFDLQDIPPAARGVPQIEVTFDIDANGILHVSAKDKATGKEQSIEIKASSGLNEDEVEQMVKDAEANAEEDKKFEELVQARNRGDSMIHAVRKSIEEAGDQATEEEKSSIESAISELEEAMKGDDKEDIEAKTQKLTEASSSLAQKMYSQEGGEAEGQADAGQQGQEGGDDAVDAEFEEVNDDDKR